MLLTRWAVQVRPVASHRSPHAHALALTVMLLVVLIVVSRRRGRRTVGPASTAKRLSPQPLSAKELSWRHGVLSIVDLLLRLLLLLMLLTLLLRLLRLLLLLEVLLVLLLVLLLLLLLLLWRRLRLRRLVLLLLEVLLVVLLLVLVVVVLLLLLLLLHLVVVRSISIRRVEIEWRTRLFVKPRTAACNAASYRAAASVASSAVLALVVRVLDRQLALVVPDDLIIVHGERSICLGPAAELHEGHALGIVDGAARRRHAALDDVAKLGGIGVGKETRMSAVRGCGRDSAHSSYLFEHVNDLGLGVISRQVGHVELAVLNLFAGRPRHRHLELLWAHEVPVLGFDGGAGVFLAGKLYKTIAQALFRHLVLDHLACHNRTVLLK